MLIADECVQVTRNQRKTIASRSNLVRHQRKPLAGSRCLQKIARARRTRRLVIHRRLCKPAALRLPALVKFSCGDGGGRREENEALGDPPFLVWPPRPARNNSSYFRGATASAIQSCPRSDGRWRCTAPAGSRTRDQRRLKSHRR